MYQITHPLCRKPHTYPTFESDLKAFLICAPGAKLFAPDNTLIFNK